MKESIYNIFQRIPNSGTGYIAYNSFSSALALISNDEYNYIKTISETVHCDRDIEISESTISDLKSGNYIIDDEIDELDLVRERMLRARYSTSSLGLTIAPTLDCNFRCIYCYEKGCIKDGAMTVHTQDCIINFVEHFAPTINKLNITWYGGEPLLALNIIERMTTALNSICNKYNIDYSASIITNGYLLKPDIVERLIKCGISFCQITIDGNRDDHNTRRPHFSGCDTYDIILDNAYNASKHFDVSVRVNVDKNNRDAISTVRKKFLEKGASNINVYPAPIRSNYNCYSTDVCFNTVEFIKFEFNYYESLNDISGILRKYPRQQGNACCADALNTYVIAPNGDLFKCWSDIGRSDRCIGNIVTGGPTISKSIIYSKFDATREEDCRNCKFLPVCMGGCPRDAIENPNDHCLYFQQIYEIYLNQLVLLLEE